MNKIKHIVASLMLSVGLIGSFALPVSASPITQFAARCPNAAILTFPAWYKNLECEDGHPKLTDLNDIWVIALNIVETLIGIAAYVAVGFIIWAGFKYIRSRGDPGKITEAKSAIIQAITGLGIALASTAIVRYVESIVS